MTSDLSSLQHESRASDLIKAQMIRCFQAWDNLDHLAQQDLVSYWHEMGLVNVSAPNVMDELLWVAMVGGTNVGKSTLFNLICGSFISPVKVTASATKYPLVRLPEHVLDYVDEPSPLGKLTLCPAPESVITPVDFDMDQQLASDKRRGPVYVSTASSAPIGLDPSGLSNHESTMLKWLASVALIDCPDHDSVRQENAETALWVALRADLCLYVTTPQKYKSDSNVDVITSLLRTGQEIWLIMNLTSIEQGQSLEIFWEDILADVSLALMSDEQDLLIRFHLAGALPRAENREELHQLRPRVCQLLSFFEKIPPQRRKRRREVDRFKVRCQPLLKEIHTLKIQRIKVLDRYIDELQRAILALDWREQTFGEPFLTLVDEYRLLGLRGVIMQQLRGNLWSVGGRVYLSSHSTSFVARGYYALLECISSHLILTLLQDGKDESQMERYPMWEPDAYDDFLAQVNRREIDWSCDVYVNLCHQVISKLDPLDKALHSILEQVDKTIRSEVSSRLNHHLASSSNLGLEPYDFDEQRKTIISPFLLAMLSAIVIGVSTGWLMSWITAFLFDNLLSSVVGWMLGILMGLVGFDIISILITLRTYGTQGAMMKEFERQGHAQARYEQHQALWCKVSLYIRSYLMSSQVVWTHPLDDLESQVVALSQLIGKDR